MQKNMKSLRDQVSGILKDHADAGDLELKQPVTFTPEEVKEAMDKIDSHLNSCLDVTYNFNIDMHSAKTRINDVNHTLRVNVNNVRMFVQHENDRLKASTKTSRDDMYEMQQTVGYVLHELRMKVNGSIKFQVENLVSMLKNKVADIRAQLKDVNKLHRKYVDALTQWIKDVDMFIEQQGEKNVQKILDEVKWSNDGNKPQNWNNVVCAADELKAKAQSLCTAGQAARVAAEQYVREAQDAVYHLDYGLKQDLKKMREDIKTKIWQEIKTLKVMDLGGDVNVDLRRLESGIKESVTTYIKGYVNAVKTNVGKIKGNGQDDGLAGVNKHIVEIYAKEFKNGTDAFDKIVKTWLEDIFKYNVSVKDSIKEALDKIIINLKHLTLSSTYVDKIKSKIEDGQIQHIAGAIKDRIKTEGSVTFETFEHRGDASPNVQKTIDAVYKCVNNFATTLGNKLGKDEHDSPTRKQFVKDIASEIGKKVVQDGSDDSGLINYLIDAATAILAALYSKASDIASELKSLAAINGYSKSQVGKKLDDAYNDANNLSTQLSAALRGSNRHAYVPDPGSLSKPDDSLDTKIGAAIDGQFTSGPTVIVDVAGSQAAYELSKVMKSFHTNYSEIRKSLRKNIEGKVDQEIGTEKEHGGTYDFRMKSLSLDKLESYIKCIGQDNIKNGSLPKAIENIENHVKSALSPIDGLNDEAKQQFQKVDQHLDVLCAVIRRDGEELKDQLKILKNNKIAKELKQIKDDLDNLRKTMFYNVLRETRHFIEEVAPRLEKETIQCLQDFLNNEVQKAKNLLTTRARRNYVTSVKALLQAFANKVTQELEGLPEKIDRDLRIGFKGFMKSLAGNDNKNINFLKEKKDVTNVRDFAHVFKIFYELLHMYLDKEIKRVHKEENEKNQKPSTDETFYTTKLQLIYNSLQGLLNHITEKQRYDYSVPILLDDLTDAVSKMKPEDFEMSNTPLLDGIGKGLNDFVRQLRKVYISRYDSRMAKDQWVIRGHKATTKGVETQDKFTEEGRNCAKVCITILSTFFNELHYLFYHCDTWWNKYSVDGTETKDEKRDKLKEYLTSQGYDMENLNKLKKGSDVALLLNQGFKSHNEFKNHVDVKTPFYVYIDTLRNSANPDGVISKLHYYLSTYNNVGHIKHIPSPRTPCSIYEMLTWCCGLQYNSVYSNLVKYCLDYDTKDNKKDDHHFQRQLSDAAHYGIRALCNYSRKILCTILGTGDEHTLYASDFANNYLNLSYPSSGEACLDTLLDILRRMFPVCRFLYSQCNSLSSDFGWAGCQYGKEVKHTNWQCDKHIADKESDCVPRSPLMSYFTDSLPGHLPHQLSSIGCRATCSTCPKSKPGQPCLTPLGFRGFSGSTRLGKDLCNVLTKMLDDADLRSLFCLKPKTPASLPEHFGFVLSLVNDWTHGTSTAGKHLIQDAFKKSISDVSISLYENVGTLTDALRDAYGSSQSNHESNKHEDNDTIDGNDDVLKKRDVSSLSMTIACSGQNVHCAPYLATLCRDSCTYFANKHCNLYLSWAVYLPWDFWNCLNNLYNAFCGIVCRDWGCRGCVRGDKCKKGKHGVIDEKSPCNCLSIVQCKGVSATLYSYGFMYGNADKLNAESVKRKCSDFCSQLKKVLSSKYFGLEKFLGYHDGNYTGSGIVYSDLDRLCDGVMAFLQGVLDTVKDDESVTTYDKDNKIKNLPSKIGEFMHKGSHDFQDAITQVSEALRAWSGELEGRTKLVKSTLDTLSTNIDSNIDTISNVDTSPQHFDAEVDKWPTMVVGSLLPVLYQADNASKGLDKVLQNKIKGYYDMLQLRINNLEDIAERDLTEMRELGESVGERLKVVKHNVRSKVRDEIAKLRDRFKEISQVFIQRLEDIDCMLKANVRKLESWIGQAKENLYLVLQKVEAISEKLKKESSPSIYHSAMNLKDTARELLRAYGNAKDRISNIVESATKALGTLDTNLKTNMKTLKDQMNTAIDKYVDSLGTGLLNGINRAGKGQGTPGVSGLYAQLRDDNGALYNVLHSAGLGGYKGFGKMIEDALKALNPHHATLSHHSNTFSTYIKRDLRSKVDDKFPEETDLQGQTATKVQLKNLTSYENDKTGVTAEIGKILSDGFEKHFKDQVPSGKWIDAMKNLDPRFDKVKEQLSDLSRIIQNGDNTGIKDLLNMFENDKIGKQLKRILSVIDGILLIKLTPLINDIKNFTAKTLQTAAQYTTKTINEFVKTEVVNATNAIKTEALERYKTVTLKELKALKTDVGSLVELILNTISIDSSRGVKGLLNKLNDSLSDPEINLKDEPKSMSDLAREFKNWLYGFDEQMSLQKDFASSHPKISPTMQAAHDLLADLQKFQHFDYHSNYNLDALKTQLSRFVPENFCDGDNPLLLDALKAGMDKFTEQLGHAYVNKYSGMKFNGDLLEDKKDAETKKPSPTEKVLSTEGRNCAKVCLTILERVSEDLMKLKERCKYEWHSKEIHRISGLGAFLKDCGYIVSNRDKQDGELRRHENMTGNHILQKLTATLANIGEINKHLKECESNKKNGTDTQPQNDDVKVFAILSCLFTHLHEYNKVGHIATFNAKKSPCSIYEMLTWCCGLEYNSAYSKMQQHCQKLCDDEKDSYLKTILSKLHKDGLPYLSSNSRNILTAILGTGDEHTLYASDFANNYLNLSYPSSGEACLDTLLDILRRMFPVCRFLYSQCNSLSSDFGWAGCQYGKEVKHTNWQCDKHIADKESDCVPRSPLMSYFTDSLPGHLPHQLSSIGCRATCSTCPKSKPGQPCLTPLGFRGFSGSTRLGKDLCNVLTKMLDDADLRSLFCLKPKTPASLPEHFGFVLSLVNDWTHGTSTAGKHLIQDAFKKSISDVSISLYENVGTLTDALRDAYGSSQSNHESNKHEDNDTIDGNDDVLKKRDVSSLSMTIACSGQNVHCAPYLATLCRDSCTYFANKHCNLYLSWAVYLPWDF
ncbi:hypothetical protein, conserved [Babesia ovata]|uniref:C3H1-type domain-containing protein n=1 Tax=Babesia ovata TaxID=189622 RepID=A0A2H6KI03_9APIC|nr:uncharacterized protein BOVATA_041040 [Babesia ovata]GBE62611.1 hypothetical protein, conserved [Babesia ovata]